MKAIIRIFFLSLIPLIAYAESPDLNKELEALKRQGLVVRMGELTGAGGKMSLSRVHSFIHPEGIIKKSACSVIKVKTESHRQDPLVADVTQLKIGNEDVLVSELVGVVTLE